MEPSRAATLFNIRYAVRVLERHSRLWRRIDGAVRLVAVLAGSGAIGAIGADDARWALGLGAVFALFQAVEFALRPADIAGRSTSQRKLYASLYASARSHDDAALAEGYDRLIADDDIDAGETLRRLAYNDVVRERGLDESECFPNTRHDRLVAFFA